MGSPRRRYLAITVLAVVVGVILIYLLIPRELAVEVAYQLQEEGGEILSSGSTISGERLLGIWVEITNPSADSTFFVHSMRLNLTFHSLDTNSTFHTRSYLDALSIEPSSSIRRQLPLLHPSEQLNMVGRWEILVEYDLTYKWPGYTWLDSAGRPVEERVVVVPRGTIEPSPFILWIEAAP